MSFFSNFTGRTPVSKIPPFAKSSSPIPLYSKHLPLKTVRSTRPKLSLRTLPSVKMNYPPTTGWPAFLFHFFRIIQAALIISITGLTSNFVSELASNSFSTPSELVLMLVVACVVLAYIVISYLLYCCRQTILPISFFAAEVLCSIAFAAVFGGLNSPVTYLRCGAFPKQGNTANFIHSLFANAEHATSENYDWLLDPSKKSCEGIKAIWALCIPAIASFPLFTFATCLYNLNKPPKALPRGTME